MITPKAGIFDRIEQSVDIFRKNFLEVSIPLIILFSLFSILNDLFVAFIISRMNISEETINNPITFFLQSEFLIALIVFMLGILMYGVLYIFFYLATFKGIIQAYREEQVSPLNNISYGFKSLWNASKTYYYKFMYVYLIPAIVFILGSVFFLWSLYSGAGDFIFTASGIVFFLILILVIFTVYRGTKATFALYSAIDKESFTKENFKQSVVFTHNNWWRIVGNLLLLGFAISFIVGILNGLISAFIPSRIGGDLLSEFDIDSLQGGISPESIAVVTEVVNNYVYSLGKLHIFSLLKGVIGSVINAISTTFAMMFVFILFKRLEFEYFEAEGVEIKNISQMKHESRDYKEKNNEKERGVIEEL